MFYPKDVILRKSEKKGAKEQTTIKKKKSELPTEPFIKCALLN